ncbi:MAG: hypothetical protein IJB69_08295 [Clostridia bacterium]|nr:hypothetical protein [Clostridia bacterium]
MSREKNNNAVLIELVIVLFFFILSFAVLSQVYAGAYVTENKASLRSDALHQARNLNALLMAGEDVQKTYDEAGTVTDAGLVVSGEGYHLVVHLEQEEKPAGTLFAWTISAQTDGEEMFSLPGAHYVPEVSGNE